jgi:hypothetical protein
MENQEEVKPVVKSKAQVQAEQQRIAKLQREQQLNYQTQMKQMKAETEDNIIRINWFKARRELSELNKQYNDEKTAELNKIKWIIDELSQTFNLDKKDAMYAHFNIPVVEPIKTEEESKETE